MPQLRFPAALLASTAALAAAMPAAAAPFFDRIASFPVARNLPAGSDPATPTSAEIVAASGDGMTLVYTDSPNKAVGFIDIADPAAPAALGSLAFDGEPTAVSTSRPAPRPAPDLGRLSSTTPTALAPRRQLRRTIATGGERRRPPAARPPAGWRSSRSPTAPCGATPSSAPT